MKLDTEIKGLLSPSAGETAPELRRRYGRIAAVIYVGAAVLSVPSTVLLENGSDGASYALTALALVIGLACMVVPWERISAEWLHVVAIAGTVHIAAAVALIDVDYGFYLVFVVGFVTYVFPRWDTLAAYLGLMTIALVAPVLLDPDTGRETLRSAVLYLPGLGVVGMTMVYLRDRLLAKEEAYNRFARDVLGITSHIRDSAARRAGAVDSAAAKQVGNGNVSIPIAAMLADARSDPRPDPLEAAWRSLRSRRDFVPVAALVSVAAAACVIVLAVAGLSLIGPDTEVGDLAVDVPPPLVAPTATGPDRVAADRSRPQGERPAGRDRGGAAEGDVPAVAGSRAPDDAAEPVDEPSDGAAPESGAQADLAIERPAAEPEPLARASDKDLPDPGAGSTGSPDPQSSTADVLGDVIGGGLDAVESLLGRSR